MDRISFVRKFDLSHGWGKPCDHIQNLAIKILTDKEIDNYYMRSAEDYAECEGSDFVCFNGQYFDWKEFYYNAENIVLAYLDYFSDEQLERMSAVIGG